MNQLFTTFVELGPGSHWRRTKPIYGNGRGIEPCNEPTNEVLRPTGSDSAADEASQLSRKPFLLRAHQLSAEDFGHSVQSPSENGRS